MRLRRALVILLLLIAMGTALAGCMETPADPPGTSYRYAASRNSDVFHYMSCRYVDAIKPSNLLMFSSRDAAVRSGRRPLGMQALVLLRMPDEPHSSPGAVAWIDVTSVRSWL